MKKTGWLQRQMILHKAGNYAEKVAIKAEFKREDAKFAAEKQQQEQEKRVWDQRDAEHKAVMEELKARKEAARAQKRTYRAAGRYSISSPYKPISRKGKRLC